MPESILGVGSTDVIPDTSKPVSHYHVKAYEQNKHHGSILDVPVDFAYHSAKSEQSDYLERAE